MRKSRWLAPWKDDPEKPVIYHVVSRIVDRRFVLGDSSFIGWRHWIPSSSTWMPPEVNSFHSMSN